MREKRSRFYVTSFLIIIGVIVGQFLVPLISSIALDKLVALGGTSFDIWDQFGGYISIFAGLLFLELIIWRVQIYIWWGYQQRTMKTISEACFEKLIYESSRFHTNRFGGALVNQVNKFVGAYERLGDEFMFSILSTFVAFIATGIILWPKTPQFVIFFSLISSVFLVSLVFRARTMVRLQSEEAAAQNKQTAQLADSITNIQTVKSFAHEQEEISRFKKRTSHVLKRGLILRDASVKTDIFVNIFTSTLYFSALVFGIYAVAKNGASIGTILLITSYSGNLTRRLWEMNRVMKNVARGFGDAHDMTQIFQLKQEVSDPIEPKELNVIRGDIKIQNISYAYPEQPDMPLFKNLDIHIKPGEKVGLVGRSGGGKTSLTKLMLRQMDLSSGTIFIDNIDISSVKQRNLRSKIAYVPQEPLMFHRSIAENIGYGRPDATDKEIMIVAKMSHADEFIASLPKQYETLVGERGTKLSGGQRQRVAIARAMLKNAPILLLDEATSALDSESESLIQDALWKLMENKTAIVIAHRLSTIQKMDRILVMEHGRIVEEGSHKELLGKKGKYAELWSHQSGGFLED